MSKKTEASPGVQDVKLPVISLALDAILVDEAKNLRRFNPDAKSVEELALDIRQNGMMNPVLVRPLMDGDGPGYELVAGYQRMKALAYLNDNGSTVDSVAASVVEIPEDDLRKAKILNLKENLRRSEISHIDSAYAVKELQELGMTGTEIAKEFGKSAAWVSYVASLLTLRPEVQKKIHNGTVTWKLARTLPGMSETEQDAAILQVEKGGSATEVAKQAKKGKKGKKGRKTKGEQTEASNISSKQAILDLEGLITELSVEPEEKPNKADLAAAEYAVKLYKDVVKFLSGSIGVKALHNRVMKGV